MPHRILEALGPFLTFFQHKDWAYAATVVLLLCCGVGYGAYRLYNEQEIIRHGRRADELERALQAVEECKRRRERIEEKWELDRYALNTLRAGQHERGALLSSAPFAAWAKYRGTRASPGPMFFLNDVALRKYYYPQGLRLEQVLGLNDVQVFGDSLGLRYYAGDLEIISGWPVVRERDYFLPDPVTGLPVWTKKWAMAYGSNLWGVAGFAIPVSELPPQLKYVPD